MSKIKNAIPLIAILLLLVLSYFIGVYFPINNQPLITLDPNKGHISAYEYWSLIINGVLAFLTLCTIFVALLKDEIVGLWKKVVFEARFENEHGFVENISKKSTPTSAENYQLKIHVTNCGTINAFDCRVIVSRIIYINATSKNTRDIKFSDRKIPTTIDNQIFSPSTSFEFVLAEVSLKKEHSIKDPTGPVKPEQPEPVLIIAGNQIDRDHHSGQIEVHFSIHCNSTASLKKIVSIQWDGKWEERLTDIQPNRLKATLKNKAEQ